MNDLIQNEQRNADELVANPFGAVNPMAASIGTAQAVSHELAEMQAQIYLAKQFPRDQRQATENILTACQRPGLANVAVYSYARGGTNVTGASIRLAEEIARNWGNLECGWNELERDADKSKVRAFAWDKETNVLKTLFFYVPHYRSTKTGRKRITEERDLYELLANQAARRMRNCILALIPGDVIDAAVEQCQKTMVTHVDISPESIRRLVDAFGRFGVSKTQIEKRIQRRIESIAPAQFVKMREIYMSLADGMSAPEDWFDPETEAGTDKLAQAERTATNLLKASLNIARTVVDPSNDKGAVDSPTNENGAGNGQETQQNVAKKTPGRKSKKESAEPLTLLDKYRERVFACETEEAFAAVEKEFENDQALADDDRHTLRDMVEALRMNLEYGA